MDKRTDTLSREHHRLEEVSAEDLLPYFVSGLREIVRLYGVKAVINSPDPYISTAVLCLLIGIDPVLDQHIKLYIDTILDRIDEQQEMQIPGNWDAWDIQPNLHKIREAQYTNLRSAILELQSYKVLNFKILMKRIERGGENPEITKVKVDAISRFANSVEALASSHGLSDQEITDVLSKTIAHVHDIFQAARNHIPFEETVQQKAQALEKKGDIFVRQTKPEGIEQAPDLSDIPLWRGRKQDEMPLDFIRTHYGQWLSAFGAEQDVIYQDQIRKHDPKLLQGIENQLREERQGRKVKEFVKPRSARIDRELATFPPDSLKHAESLRVAKRRRQAKALPTSKPSSE